MRGKTIPLWQSICFLFHFQFLAFLLLCCSRCFLNQLCSLLLLLLPVPRLLLLFLLLVSCTKARDGERVREMRGTLAASREGSCGSRQVAALASFITAPEANEESEIILLY